MEQFPLPLRGCIRVSDGYELEPVASFVRTEMEVGAARQAPRDPGSPVPLRCVMEFNQAQQAMFDAWYRYKVADGVDFFELPLAIGETVALREVRFTRAPRSRLLAKGVWITQCEIELRTMPLMTEAALDALLGL